MLTKKDIVKMLETIAIYMEIKGENPFKVSAYRKASQSLETDERTLNEIEDVTSLKGIGKGVGDVINEYIDNGTQSYLDELKQEIPEGLIPLLKIPGLGSKKIAKLYKELDIKNKEDLIKACENNQVSELPGFAKKTEQKLLEEAKVLGQRPEKYSINTMIKAHEVINQFLDNIEDINQYQVAGSFRRIKEMSKDLDYIISTEEPTKVQQALLEFPDIKEQIAVGQTKVSLDLQIEDDVIGVDFRLIQPKAFYHTLQHFTGSKDHNIKIRQLAKQKNEKVSEYGIEEANGNIITYQSEKEIYDHFNVSYIPPTMREDGIEFDKDIQDIIQLEDINGDIHMHTTYSDGAFKLEEMIEAAIERQYQFICITDHSRSLAVANGLSIERLLEQNEKIKKLNESYKEIDIYSGTEMDIKPDGSLDYPDDVLKELDYVIAAIHQSFNQSEEEIMNRLRTACENQYVRHIAHPTGRIIGRREGYRPNIDELIKMARETNTVLELNANPQRLDLNADVLKNNPDLMITINTDAHHIDHFDFMKYGVGTAQKGWVKKSQVINAKSREAFKKWIQSTK
ncbi:DNA polymerase/3'-5' exonuclease PolX [Mammaliicoccus sciuri]|uniref:DNA polymerase/3'-5' exonuclease PolX n=1 Tax=Mammaliicoccus sciuri TaxID=1296 RepID=UPI000E6782BF|nr:DNA polymerase/3'-5' exonuclease PolX [Mammaliicoccus sciuri]MCD8896532.1 DNA polymerase/3'-5' exonuclease PolX [Mammaliicoccus sciuri]MEB6231912.1 DNA polymerase/3'-5' exonuclease PolX [Mammaliicoccus sciuri]MEB7732960.1 DNA polymerase/3'-5' exonuclease PolX [Mammaliicoccus sciuri]MEB8263367.1 DNA polymerase/3'-5' exonuclease PolX [Mammaliicoccus sciuri]MRE70929.1 DNA polymerase/3'-5' exonuclease PolX [Mammaliicoccus sciuri]